MCLDRRLGEVQLGRDLGVRQTPRDEPQHVALALGERVQQRPLRDRLGGHGCERLDDAQGHRRVEQAAPRGDGPDGGDELLGRGDLEQEAAHAGPERLGDVLVPVEGREHDHLRPGMGGEDAPRALDAVDPWHPDVHEDDVG